jgi:hypothetical protein
MISSCSFAGHVNRLEWHAARAVSVAIYEVWCPFGKCVDVCLD